MFFDDSNDVDIDIADSLSETLVEVLGELFSSKKADLDEVAEKSSAEIDKLIIKELREGKEFIAGRFKLVYVDDSNFKFAFETYFKPPHRNDYFCLDGASDLIPMRKLQELARNELKIRREVVYDIDPPTVTGAEG